jgi:hypothetical protein
MGSSMIGDVHDMARRAPDVARMGGVDVAASTIYG